MSKTVIIIDDEELLIELVGKALTKRGFEIKGYTNGPDATKEISKSSPDLVILDYYFDEGPDGLNICHEIKSNEASKNVPVILATGMALLKEPTGCDPRLIRPDAVIIKPFEITDLLNIIENLLGPAITSSNP